MDFLELAKKRYSERDFADRKVEPDKLASILESGRIAPTAANVQPQRILVVREKEGMDKLGKAAQLYHAPLALVVCTDASAAWTRPFDGKKTTDIDASIVTTHMMLEAANLGLASVWICYFKADVLRKEFDIPADLEPVNILAVGYAKGQPASPDRHDTMRKPLAETVFYEKF